MTFNPDPNGRDQILDAPIFEYLGCQPGRDHEHFVAVISVRPMPGKSFAFKTFSLTKDQVVRLRDDLNSLITTPGSWLYVPPEPEKGARDVA